MTCAIARLKEREFKKLRDTTLLHLYFTAQVSTSTPALPGQTAVYDNGHLPATPTCLAYFSLAFFGCYPIRGAFDSP